MKKLLNMFEYNSPVVLTFALLSVVIYLFDAVLPIGIIENGFIYSGGVGVFDFVRLITWPLGHGSIEHLMGNLTLLLLIGPMLEEKYSSKVLLVLFIVTAIIIGGVQGFFINGGILGASGIVFMLIILTSFTNMQSGKVPLTFVLIIILFVVKEVYNGIFANNNVSELAHILGAVIGIGFVWLDNKVLKTKR